MNMTPQQANEFWSEVSQRQADRLGNETCYATVLSNNKLPEPGISFDTDSTTCVLDNCSNTHIWNNAKDFHPGTLKPVGLPKRNAVTTIGGKDLRPQGVGKVKISWMDDHGVTSKYFLNNVLWFPSSPFNV